MKDISYFFEKNILKNIYISLPIVLITGPFLPDLFVIIISLYFILNINNFKNDEIFSNKFHWAFIVFIWQYVFHHLHLIIVHIH